MKKLLIGLVLILTTLLVGCEQDTATINNVEYISKVTTNSSGTMLIFLHNDEEIAFNVESDDRYFLQEGKKYNVEYTIEDFGRWGDYIVSIEESN